MTVLDLNADWQVEYFHPDVDEFEFAASRQPVPSLQAWQCERRFLHNGYYAWLEKSFDLAATDHCVQYLLSSILHPAVTVYLNERKLHGDQLNVTDCVWLEANRLQVRVDGSQIDADFRLPTLRLLQVDCLP